DNVTEEKPQLVDGKAYQLPPFELLDTKIESGKSAKNKSAAQIKGDKLIDVLSDFNIKADLVDIHIGPSVTKFEIRPDSSVKVSRISSIQDNIKMELAARNIRIEAPIPGKNTVGIEIPNIETTPVKLYELLSDMPEVYDNKPLLFTLGKDLTGNIVYSDLTKMPHLLIAGATGAGKSVAMNAIITTILIRTTPAQVRLLLIDPKKVEFSAFAHIPHLITPIITEPEKANNALAKVVDLMDDRYRAFADIGVKNIAAYNDYREKHPAEKLDNLELIVVIIDELADLMLVAGKEVEMSIQRITQLARAAGIHLIVATQRPSTDVITGIIKANIPSRISFAVSSGIDSRTILDATGAERLLGNGDMLYYPVTHSAPSRLQGVYVTDEEVSKIANFVSKGPSPDHFKDFENLDENGDLAQMPMAFDDPLYDEVKMFVVREQKASTSLIQRSFGIGYNRAARIIDALEAKDIIGPMQGSKPRDVNISIDDLDSEE
ncbi:MAG TPA: DNA translocase FtsK, partial [Erysipelotrichaceae bacterium]|nr:DNA translocase FtsK [Erysipelotrichaceae bacterium]